jgi:hypothetical protein
LRRKENLQHQKSTKFFGEMMQSIMKTKVTKTGPKTLQTSDKNQNCPKQQKLQDKIIKLQEQMLDEFWELAKKEQEE